MRKIVIISKNASDGKFIKELEVFADKESNGWILVKDNKTMYSRENPVFPDKTKAEIAEFLKNHLGKGYFRVFIASHDHPITQTLWNGYIGEKDGN